VSQLCAGGCAESGRAGRAGCRLWLPEMLPAEPKSGDRAPAPRPRGQWPGWGPRSSPGRWHSKACCRLAWHREVPGRTGCAGESAVSAGSAGAAAAEVLPGDHASAIGPASRVHSPQSRDLLQPALLLPPRASVSPV